MTASSFLPMLKKIEEISIYYNLRNVILLKLKTEYEVNYQTTLIHVINILINSYYCETPNFLRYQFFTVFPVNNNSATILTIARLITTATVAIISVGRSAFELMLLVGVVFSAGFEM